MNEHLKEIEKQIKKGFQMYEEKNNKKILLIDNETYQNLEKEAQKKETSIDKILTKILKELIK